MHFGVGLFGGFESAVLTGLVRLIDRVGVTHLWIADEGLYRNPYVALTQAACSSSRLQLGTGVTNPYTRHPALTAASIATIDEVSRGRAVLGLGAGGSGPLALSLTRRRPIEAVRDTIAIVNALTGTGAATYTGQALSFTGALSFQPRRRVPIYLAATGTQMLRLAGEVADGVIIGDAGTPRAVRDALRLVEQGASRAGRRLSDLRVVIWLATAVSDTPAWASDAVRKIAAVAVLNHRHRLGDLGVTLTPAMSRVLEHHRWTRSRAFVEEFSRILSDEAVASFSLAGSAEHCLERLRSYVGLPIDQVALLFRPPRESSMEDQIRAFAERVLARL